MLLPTRYAKSGDVSIAYQVLGDGPLDLVFVMGWVSHLDAYWEEPGFARFLQRLAGFSRLILLDKRGRWERDLSIDEQLLVGFARVVLQAPPWLVMDQAFSAFDDDTLERIIDVLNGPLAHAGIVHIGSAGEAHDRLFTRIVHLVKAPGAPEPRA